MTKAADDERARQPATAPRIALETTLREVESNAELEYFIHKRARQLEAVVASGARCTVVVRPRRRSASLPQYEVDIRVVGERDYAHSQQLDTDVLLAVRDAFDVVQRRLERSSSGVRVRGDATTDDEPGKA